MDVRANIFQEFKRDFQGAIRGSKGDFHEFSSRDHNDYEHFLRVRQDFKRGCLRMFLGI